MYDCIIIGSGVAGLSAAIYLGRVGKSVMIVENGILGGTTATLDRIDNYPGVVSCTGLELVQNMIQQVTSLGVNIDFLNISSIDFDNKKIICEDNSYEYKTLIIASGSSVKKLGITNESKYLFKGLSYCAVCDGSLYRNKKIIVVTDGVVGKQSVDYLKNISDNITVLDIRNNFKDESLQVYNNVNIIDIVGLNKVDGIKFNSNKQEYTIDCDAIFISLGKQTDLSLYSSKLNTSDGFIAANDDMHTSIKGVFVAGDIRKKSLRQIVTACSDGAIAATEAIKYINNN